MTNKKNKTKEQTGMRDYLINRNIESIIKPSNELGRLITFGCLMVSLTFFVAGFLSPKINLFLGGIFFFILFLFFDKVT